MKAAVRPQPHLLHRLSEARKSERLTSRCMARRLNISLTEVLEQENPANDLPLSVLARWARALGVPMAELLVDSTPDHLSPAVHMRCRLVRVMKTVRALQERTEEQRVRNMAERLVNDLVAIMPELKTITAWNDVGTRRRLDEYGQAALRARLLGGILRSFDSPLADEPSG